MEKDTEPLGADLQKYKNMFVQERKKNETFKYQSQVDINNLTTTLAQRDNMIEMLKKDIQQIEIPFK